MAINAGQGTIIEMTISSTLTAIAQVVEASGGGISVPKVKNTNLGSTSQVFAPACPRVKSSASPSNMTRRTPRTRHWSPRRALGLKCLSSGTSSTTRPPGRTKKFSPRS